MRRHSAARIKEPERPHRELLGDVFDDRQWRKFGARSAGHVLTARA
ncbi:hypothetical protein [Micromonospora sp. NPDC003776]